MGLKVILSPLVPQNSIAQTNETFESRNYCIVVNLVLTKTKVNYATLENHSKVQQQCPLQK